VELWQLPDFEVPRNWWWSECLPPSRCSTMQHNATHYVWRCCERLPPSRTRFISPHSLPFCVSPTPLFSSCRVGLFEKSKISHFPKWHLFRNIATAKISALLRWPFRLNSHGRIANRTLPRFFCSGQCGVVCCRVVQHESVVQWGAVWCSVEQCAATWCSLLQFVAVCCSLLQFSQCFTVPSNHVSDCNSERAHSRESAHY